MILPSDSDRVGGATFIILLRKKQNYKSTAWFMHAAGTRQGSREQTQATHLTSNELLAHTTRHSCSVPHRFLVICISRARPGIRSNKEENKIDMSKDTIQIFMIGTFIGILSASLFFLIIMNQIKYFCCSEETDFMRYLYFHIGQRVSLKITISNFLKIKVMTNKFMIYWRMHMKLTFFIKKLTSGHWNRTRDKMKKISTRQGKHHTQPKKIISLEMYPKSSSNSRWFISLWWEHDWLSLGVSGENAHIFPLICLSYL